MNFDPLNAIATHAEGLASAAESNLDARVEHCPDWDVADLVAHITNVHWFWATIVEEKLQEPPAEERRPARAEDLLGALRANAERLVRVLGEADPATPVWTWAPDRMTAGFVLRHQVQEAAVHHWDAENAAGRALTIEALPAADAVDEFLAVSVASEAWPGKGNLDGTFGMRTTDADGAWTITDGVTPHTLAVTPGLRDGIPVLQASASDLLLWLYRRVELDTSAVPPDLVERFRSLTFTD